MDMDTESTADTSGHRAEALLWEQPASPKRGPKPTLSLEVIARTGIEIADLDGLASVTMQRVAETLSVTKMALYRYVPGKAELVALMTETALGGPPRLDAMPGNWRTKLYEWARQMFDRFCLHPWALESTVGARPLGPNELGWLEQAVATLTGSGLDGGEILDVAVTLVGHIRGVAQQGTAMATEVPEQTMESALNTLLRGREERFPALTAALASTAAHGSHDQALDFGLRRILDGVNLLIVERSRGRRSFQRTNNDSVDLGG
jgi:AcrR family transcriptional regulator